MSNPQFLLPNFHLQDHTRNTKSNKSNSQYLNSWEEEVEEEEENVEVPISATGCHMHASKTRATKSWMFNKVDPALE